MSASHAIVIATYSRRMRLRMPRGEELDARIKGKELRPVCGDRVTAEPIPGETDWLITGVADRYNVLSRPNMRGQTEILAANIDLLVAVAASTPKPDWFVIDRYLAAAENMPADSVIVVNKIDVEADAVSTDRTLAEYAQAGYRTLRCSAIEGTNIAALLDMIDYRTAIVVGQSGVGKSSLINRMLGRDTLRTADISDKRGEGRHTTVNSEMLSLPTGGVIIDSPGVRDFAPALDDGESVGRGFREIDALRDSCRFANCQHLREPDCAVKRAVEDGIVSHRRYESYRRLLKLTLRLTQSR